MSKIGSFFAVFFKNISAFCHNFSIYIADCSTAAYRFAVGSIDNASTVGRSKVKKEHIRVLVRFLQTAFLTAVVSFALCPISCKVTDEGLQLLHGDYAAPVLESYAAESEKRVLLSFSERVTITGAIITRAAPFSDDALSAEDVGLSPALKVVSGETDGISVGISYGGDGRTAIAEAAEALEAGAQYALYGEARDENGNTLTFCVPFIGFNSRIPKIVISGVHPQFVSAPSGGGDAKCEFVELYALTDGNIAGLAIQSAADGIDRAFTLPAAEVRAGDVIIVHLRTKGDGCVSETGGDLSLASGWYTSPAVRDIWSPNEKACLGDKEDAVMLANAFTGDILDAVLYAHPESAAWSNGNVKAAAQKIAAKGIWKSVSIEDGASTDGLTASKMLKRSGCIALRQKAENGTLGDIIEQAKEHWRVEKIVKGAVNSVE